MGKVGLIDYGSGNFTSVKNALEFLEIDMIHVQTGRELDACSHIILPGVGAYAAAMTKVESLSIIESLTEQVRIRKKPFLGICVGMQLLSNVGKEFVEYPGLGYIAGSVEKLKTEPYDLPLPHIGWNNLHIEKNGSLLFKDMAEEPHFYFVHSYHFIPEEPNVISATCDYGCTFAAAIEQDNIFGVQFHPEKSQYDGLQLLKNFAAIS